MAIEVRLCRSSPERIQRIWNQFIDWRRKERHYLNGELFVVEPIARWGQSTAKKYTTGWFCATSAGSAFLQRTDR